MSETLEKEILEEEKKASCTLFETDLFKHVFNSLANPDSELSSEIKSVLLDEMKEFVKKQINIKEDCSNLYNEALEIAFYVGFAITMSGDLLASFRKEKESSSKTSVLKRIIRKENCIGFTVTFKGEKNIGKIILAKEHYDSLIQEGRTTNEIVKMALNDDNKIIEKVELMPADELDKLLDLSADKILEEGLGE